MAPTVGFDVVASPGRNRRELHVDVNCNILARHRTVDAGLDPNRPGSVVPVPADPGWHHLDVTDSIEVMRLCSGCAPSAARIRDYLAVDRSRQARWTVLTRRWGGGGRRLTWGPSLLASLLPGSVHGDDAAVLPTSHEGSDQIARLVRAVGWDAWPVNEWASRPPDDLSLRRRIAATALQLVTDGGMDPAPAVHAAVRLSAEPT